MTKFPNWFKILGLVVAIVAVGILLAGILAVPLRFLRLPSGYDQPRVHLNTKNSTRFIGDTTAEVALHVGRAVYPATDPANTPDVIILYREADWQSALQAAALVRPLNALLLPDTVSGEDLNAFNAAGSDPAGGAQLLLLDGAAAPEGSALATTDLDAADVVGLLAAAGAPPRHALLVNAADPATALLAAPWAGFSGDIVVYDPEDAPPDTPLFVLGEVPGVGDVDLTRVGGADPTATAVAFAKFDDPLYPLFGWGMNADSLTGYRGYSIAPEGDIATALLSANLNRRGRPGPLLWTEQAGIPQVANNYLFSQRAAFWVTPSEGPFHHFYILGGEEAISFPAQGQVDYAVEIGPYFQKGVAAGPMDMLAAAWVALGLASALVIAFHEVKWLPQQNYIMRMAWPLLALMIGPFGIPVYWLSYDRPLIRTGEMVMWDRPLWLQGLVATASAIGFGGLLMVVTGFVTTLLGMPLVPARGPLFWLGTPMILVMVMNYVVAVLISWPLFQTPMVAMFYGISYGEALGKALPLVLVSMLAAAIAMDPGMWWFMMSKIPMMPTEESILWFGVMFVTVFLAFLMAWPFNYYFVRTQRKSGLM